jgi:hypothetical protein
VQPPTGSIGVLREVEGIELLKRFVAFLHDLQYYYKLKKQKSGLIVQTSILKDRGSCNQAFFFSILGKSERNWLQI